MRFRIEAPGQPTVEMDFLDEMEARAYVNRSGLVRDMKTVKFIPVQPGTVISMSVRRWMSVPDIYDHRNVSPAVSVTWVDPGLMSGWARWWPESGEFHSGQLDLLDLGKQLDALLDHWMWIGWERFVIQPGTSRLGQSADDLGSALEAIGVTRYMALRRGARILRPQVRSDKALGLKHIKAIGWHSPGKDHANDAAGHLLTWALKNHVLPEQLLKRLPVGAMP